MLYLCSESSLVLSCAAQALANLALGEEYRGRIAGEGAISVLVQLLLLAHGGGSSASDDNMVMGNAAAALANLVSDQSTKGSSSLTFLSTGFARELCAANLRRNGRGSPRRAMQPVR